MDRVQKYNSFKNNPVIINYLHQKHTLCGYEVPRMILLQAYLYAYSLLRGVTFETPPLSSYAFCPTMLPLLETFWNSCCGTAFSAVITFFGCLQYPEIFVPLKQTLFLETATSHLEPNKGNRVGVPFQ
jgi:hypothetical protein